MSMGPRCAINGWLERAGSEDIHGSILRIQWMAPGLATSRAEVLLGSSTCRSKPSSRAGLLLGSLELVQDSESFRCSKLFFTVVAYILILAQPAINDLCATYKSLLNPKHTESS